MIGVLVIAVDSGDWESKDDDVTAVTLSVCCWEAEVVLDELSKVEDEAASKELGGDSVDESVVSFRRFTVPGTKIGDFFSSLEC